MRLAFLSDEAEIAVWDVPTKQKAFSCGNGEQRWLGCLSADGAWYAVGGKIWDMAARKFRVALPAELSVVRRVAWSPQAERLAIGTANGDLVVWNLPRVKAKLAEIGLGR
jgi:WD40 repeat protein